MELICIDNVNTGCYISIEKRKLEETHETYHA